MHRQDWSESFSYKPKYGASKIFDLMMELMKKKNGSHMDHRSCQSWSWGKQNANVNLIRMIDICTWWISVPKGNPPASLVAETFQSGQSGRLTEWPTLLFLKPQGKTETLLSSELQFFMHNFTKQLSWTAVVLPRHLLTQPLLHSENLWPTKEMAVSFSISYFVAHIQAVAQFCVKVKYNL